ncbi:MAG: ABC transporter permease [Acidobacteriota bacterium]
MDALRHMYRHALRKLLKTPGATGLAIFALAIGIGLTVAMFGIIQGVFLRGLPFEEGHELMHLEANNLERDQNAIEISQHDFVEFVREQTSFEGLAAWTSGTINLADEGVPDRFDGSFMSPNFLELLEVKPLLGRGFEARDAEDGAHPVVLISHNVWKSRYGSDPSVIDRGVRANSKAATIIGVMPEKFRFPVTSEVWMPLDLRVEELPRGSDEILSVEVFGRLKDGVSLEQASSEMAVLARQLELQFPATNEGVGSVVKPFIEEFVDEETRQLTGVMFVAVVLVLLIACFNVANLLIGRASVRSREIAIRSALGSGRWHNLASVLAESSILSFLGAALGIGLAHVGLQAFGNSLQTTAPPFWMEFYIDTPVLLLAVFAAALSALVAGLVPAWQSARPDLRQVLSDSTRGSTSFHVGWVSKTMVVTQVAISAALLIGAGLAVRSVLAANHFEHHFDGEKVLTARVGLFEGDYPEDADRVAFFERLARDLGQRAEVDSVALGTVIPTDEQIGAGGIRYERPGEEYEQAFQRPWSRFSIISPGYFKTLGVELLGGRDFTALDHADTARVAIVNQGFADKEWPGENPIGQRIDLWEGEEAEAADPQAGVVEVVGVVPNLRFAEFDNADDQHGIYVPLAQNPVRFAWIVVKTRGAPLAFAETLRGVVLEADPNLPIYFVISMDQVLVRTMFFPNLLGFLFSLFGGAAIFLACVGLYGLMAFAVTRRTQEMGVRMALGAESEDVLRLVLGQGLRQTALGLVIGLVLGAGLSVILAGFLFQVQAQDPVTFGAVSVMLLAIATLACMVPALRASRVDPLVALRYD